MLPLESRNMRQVATYWPRTGQNAANEPTFGAPVEVRTRWEEKAVLFKTPDGRELTSQAVIYCSTLVELEGWLVLGASVATDPRQVTGAMEIQQTNYSPNLAQTRQLQKVFV